MRMINADYVLQIIGDRLYGDMSAGDENLYDHKTYDDGLEWCFELIRNVANNTAPGLHAGGAGTMNWISVKDRHPDEGHDVLVVNVRSGSVMAAYYIDGEGFFYISDEGGDAIPTGIDVSYWMELPEPPELEDGNIGQTSRESSRTGRG